MVHNEDIESRFRMTIKSINRYKSVSLYDSNTMFYCFTYAIRKTGEAKLSLICSLHP